MLSTAPKLNPPFRADHIGSLKRPAKLLQKRKDLDDGKTTQEELRVVEDEAIRNVIRMQREVGIKSITDGEFRRCAYTHCLSLHSPSSCPEAHARLARQAHVLRWGV